MTHHFPFLGKLRTRVLNAVYSPLYPLTMSVPSASPPSTPHFSLHPSLTGFRLLFFLK